ncbi:hypothetical protein YB2330_002116 [Saitoella coloradoensis]
MAQAQPFWYRRDTLRSCTIITPSSKKSQLDLEEEEYENQLKQISMWGSSYLRPPGLKHTMDELLEMELERLEAATSPRSGGGFDEDASERSSSVPPNEEEPDLDADIESASEGDYDVSATRITPQTQRVVPMVLDAGMESPRSSPMMSPERDMDEQSMMMDEVDLDADIAEPGSAGWSESEGDYDDDE